MKTVELKSILMHKIAGINDKSFLNAINTIIESKADTTYYKTKPEQREKIDVAKEQIANGEYFSDDEVDKDVDAWLSER